MERIAGWWDGFELWVAGLPFMPQFLVVLAGMIPISLALAYLLDRALRTVLRVLGRDRAGGGQRPVAPDAAATVPEESNPDEAPVSRPGSRLSEIRLPEGVEAELPDPEPEDVEGIGEGSAAARADVLRVPDWETV